LYNATDINGNVAEEVQRVVNVIGLDDVAPTIALFDDNGNPVEDGATIQVEFSTVNSWDGLTVVAFDNVDLDISDLVASNEGDVDLASAGEYTVTYTATDGSGNESSITVTIVVADTQAPVINLIGPPTLALPCGQVCVDYGIPFYEFQLGGSTTQVGYSAIDNVDGDISPDVTVSGTVDFCDSGTTGFATYTVSYDVCDAAGNCATTVTRNFIVQGDCGDPCVDPCNPDGIENTVLNAAVQVYPNPAKDVVNIAINSYAGAASLVNMYDVTGKMVYQNLNATANLSIDVSNHANGVYLLEVVTERGVVTKKLVLDK
jgi:hypothetical protein